VLSVLVGTIFTVIVQSSSATIGILQELFKQGAVNLNAALPVLFGDNIGTTITAVLAAIGTSVSAKRAAAVHVLFNLIGTVIFLLILGPFTTFIAYLQSSLYLNPEMTIAFAHGIFNLSNTLIQFPFIALLAWLVTKIIPGEDFLVTINTQHLDTRVIEQSPNIALGQANKEVRRMGGLAADALAESYLFLNTKEEKHAAVALQYEQAINRLDRVITDFLVEISTKSLSPDESQEHHQLMDTIRDIERVGDHMENIIELLEMRVERNVSFSEEALSELNEMFELTRETFQDALNVFFNGDKQLAETVFEKEKLIDQMERTLRNAHIKRMNERVCTGDAGILFVDIASNLERIGDHAASIAQKVQKCET
jgi:phosphate:Na+ symporter